MLPARKRLHEQTRGALSQQGFTMIEALVTFVILAIGVLGIVSLLVTSKTSQFEAVQRARAVAIADSIVERIRENPVMLQRYVTGLAPLGGGVISAEPSADCETAVCDPNEVAAHDMWAWEQSLIGSAVALVDDDDNATPVSGLKEPRGCVVFQPFNALDRTGRISVLVQWRGMLDSIDAVPAGGDTCGGLPAGTDTFRRQVIVNSFVVDGSEI